MRFAMLGVMVLTACGGTGSGGGGGQTAQGVLPGDPAASAAAALTDVTPSRANPANVSRGVLLDRLFAVVAKDATIGQFNAAAAAVGATAVSSSARGSLLITLRVPPLADAAHAKALAATLRAQPGILFARPAREPRADVLPVSSPGVPVPPSDLGHLLASRFPQAFNARSAAPDDCGSHTVEVYVFDKFGDSSSRQGFFDQIDPGFFVPDPSSAGPQPDEPGHGYDVALTLAAAFDGDLPTGANPFLDCVRIHQVEAFGYDLAESMLRAVNLAKAEAAPRFAMNISMNAGSALCGPANDEACTVTNLGLSDPDVLQGELQYRAILAGEWARLLASGTLTPRMLLSVSAGNIPLAPAGALERGYPGFRDATLSAPWTLATRLADIESILRSATLWKSADQALPDLTLSADDVTTVLITLDQGGAPKTSTPKDDLIIAGSTTKADNFQGLAASSFNFGNADVMAVGEGVPMPGGLFESGTSFSAPQVAGLASYLWILSPTLRGQPAADTATLIKQTAHATAAGPVIDAFAAVTSVPDARAVRLALLDVNGDGNFDHLDLQIWVDKLHLSDLGFEPAIADYSRFDLNGDGASGGSPIGGLDLDLTSQTLVSELIEDAEVEMNEAALSDLQILCYYAWSDLYAVAPPNHDEALAQRHLMLGPDRCVRAKVAANLVSVPPGGAPVTLTVTTGGQGGAPARNLFLSLTGSCATASPSSGRTDSNGHFTTLFTPGNACATAQLSVTASGDEGTPVLATQQFTATVANGNIGAESFINLDLGGFDAQTGAPLFASAFLSATTTGSDGTTPPLDLTLSGSYQPDPSLPSANFSVSAFSDGPIVVHSFAQPSSGTYTENAGCSDTGQGIQDPNSESFLFPRPIVIQASAEGAFEPDSPVSAGYTASLSFTMSRTEVVSGPPNGDASLNGSVFIDFSLAGEPSQTLEFFLGDGLLSSGDPTGPVVSGSQSFFIQKGGFVQANFGMSVKCGTEFAQGDSHAIASKRAGTLTFSYSIE